MSDNPDNRFIQTQLLRMEHCKTPNHLHSDKSIFSVNSAEV